MLTGKRQRFVDEYLVDSNGTKAAIRAGYSPKTAKQKAYVLLKEPEVAAAVAAGRKSLSAATYVTAEWVRDLFAGIASDLEQAAADRIRAGDKLARMLGLYNDKLEVRVPMTDEERAKRVAELFAKVAGSTP